MSNGDEEVHVYYQTLAQVRQKNSIETSNRLIMIISIKHERDLEKNLYNTIIIDNVMPTICDGKQKYAKNLIELIT